MNTTTINRKKIHQALNGNDPVTPEDIKYALSLANYTQARIARELECDKSSVAKVIAGERNSFNIASFIAVALGAPMNTLWADGRYSKPPKRIREAA